MKRTSKFMIFSVWTVALLGFQNCSPAFHVTIPLESTSELSSSQSPFKCSAAEDPTPISAKRLSKVELQRTFEGFQSKFATADRAAIKAGLAPFLLAIPDDNGEKFSTDDAQLSQDHVAAYFAAAKKFSEEATASLARTQAFMGTCASTGVLTNTCLDSFLSGRATSILRRPLTAAEITTIKGEYAGYSEKNNQWLITRLLMDPTFLFHLELGGVEVRPQVVNISAYELASRISFYLLRMAPDDQLLAAAADASLLNKDKITAEVNRLATQYPTYMKDSIDKFFEGWLAYKYVANPLIASTPEETAFAAGTMLKRQSLINEIQGMTRYYLFDGNGSFNDLFLSDKSFAVDDDLAKIYGVAKWSGSKDSLVSLPANERAGLLNRSAFLVSGDDETNPITRGLMVRRQFLCDEIPPPPAEIAAMLRTPDPDPNASTRQRFHDKTNASLCMSCHSLINPLGFALESYDAFGRYRTSEKMFDATGTMINQIAIDPVVQPLISSSDTSTVTSSIDFNQRMADSGKARSCMVRSFFSFAYREKPSLAKDGCALSEIDAQAQGVAGLNKMFLSTPTADAFQRRKLD